MIHFDKVKVIGSGENQKVHGLVLGRYIDGRYSFRDFERDIDISRDGYFEKNPAQSLLSVLALTHGELTQEGVDSGEEDIAPHIYLPEAANKVDVYAILPGVELQFINSWSSQNRPRGYRQVETGPGILREVGSLVVPDPLIAWAQHL